ncbi:hypothetical protein HNY73_012225 [Argiope bruennichi]|uniref:Uncharacterized protein n=1 Tax=Argiope bruennichi TaxID=94029 RepID=A0A8T0EZX4_ARGBR|nr:hypothetical protein HNY73_012225 [Argiope bruennichi]
MKRNINFHIDIQRRKIFSFSKPEVAKNNERSQLKQKLFRVQQSDNKLQEDRTSEAAWQLGDQRMEWFGRNTVRGSSEERSHRNIQRLVTKATEDGEQRTVAPTSDVSSSCRKKAKVGEQSLDPKSSSSCASIMMNFLIKRGFGE